MNTAAQLTGALAQNVADIVGTARHLLIALESEREALLSGDDSMLLRVTGVKTTLLQKLDTMETERLHLVSELYPGPTPIPFAMERALANQADTQALWDEAVELLGHCRTLNQSNGIAVEQRLRQIHQALELLRGDTHVTPQLYSAQGWREKSSRSKPIAKV